MKHASVLEMALFPVVALVLMAALLAADQAGMERAIEEIEREQNLPTDRRVPPLDRPDFRTAGLIGNPPDTGPAR